ncbi:MAG: HIT domain-containing protein [Candidatus Bathyarchaeia archaeon]
MPQKNLWAPWRMEFIRGARSEECIFCTKLNENNDEENLVLIRWEKSFAMLNLFPYNSGHTMIVPNRHVKLPSELDAKEAEELWRGVCIVIGALKKVYSPEGYNLGANIGTVSGAGFEHFHIHVVPRWPGDTNFMPVIADVKVISEHVHSTYKLLKQAIVSL